MIKLQRPKIKLTENQLKVIKDKYLKDSPSVEAWLDLVAGNIALAEVLYSKIPENEIFKGIKYQKVEREISKNEKVFVYSLHKGLDFYSERNKNFKNFLANLQELSAREEIIDQYNKVKDEFYNLMANFEFLPNSPTLMNAGRVLQQLSGCYVVDIDDSIEEIYEALKATALIFKSGGGTGYNFSKLRPKNDEVLSTQGISSGPISFMTIFDKSTDVVRQGGTRRGASMGILSYDHPDILDFIACKNKKGFLENFNISVALDEKFMNAVKNNEEYDLINPRSKQSTVKLNAKDVFDAMAKNAWASGDPGFVVIDRINNSDSNPTPHIGVIESTNPCGEQPLLPWEACNLGSINISKFIKTDSSDMDYDRLRSCVWSAMHFLDNVIDVNNYPLQKIEEMAKSNRRVGLGVMGWAETLALLKIPYNSEDAVKKAEHVMEFINDEALKASEDLAKTRGVFPNYMDSIYDKDGMHFRYYAKPRNAARTTIAPTGTIGITAGLQGAGIEPFFAVAYIRYNAAGIDALKINETPSEKDIFFEVNPVFKKIAQEHNFFGMKETELWKKIEDNHKSVQGIKSIPVEIQKLFLTAHDLIPEDHIKMQAAFQKYTNNAVSKTINMKKEATEDDVRKAFLLAYELGCKGVTIYRDGSKDHQILNISSKKTRESTGFEKSSYYELMTGQGPLHVHINYDDEGPIKVFANISPIGTEISGLTSAISILLSKYLSIGGDPANILKHLNSIKGDKPYGFGPNRIDSIPHAVSKALKDHLIKTNKLIDRKTGQTTLGNGAILKDVQLNKLQGALYCLKCFSSNVEVLSGCSGPTCFDCGYSECS